MKILINKAHPQIRITAPEITIEDAPYNNHQYVYWIPAINEMYNPIDWTLVEEEQESVAERFARIVRGNLIGIDKEAQQKFEQLYFEITGNKMYGGYND